MFLPIAPLQKFSILMIMGNEVSGPARFQPISFATFQFLMTATSFPPISACLLLSLLSRPAFLSTHLHVPHDLLKQIVSVLPAAPAVRAD